MKIKLIQFLLILGILMGRSATAAAAPRTIKGSGNLITKEIKAPEFTRLTASRGVNVTIGSGDAIVIEADDNIMEYVITDQPQRGELRVTVDPEVRNLQNVHINVQVPSKGTINSITISSSATVNTQQVQQARQMRISISSAGTLNAALRAEEAFLNVSSAGAFKGAVEFGSCDITGSSSSKIVLSGEIGDLSARLSSSAEMKVSAPVQSASVTLSSASDALFTAEVGDLKSILSSSSDLTAEHLQAEKCKITASSGADVRLGGRTRSLVATLSSSGDLRAENLESATCNITASSGSDARIYCTELLTAQASSGAEITYSGGCQTNCQKSSGGSIKKR